MSLEYKVPKVIIKQLKIIGCDDIKNQTLKCLSRFITWNSLSHFHELVGKVIRTVTMRLITDLTQTETSRKHLQVSKQF